MAVEELDPQIGRIMHQRLIAGDPRAPAEIAEYFLPWLHQRMAQLHPGIRDPHLLATAAVDAVLSYLKNPGSYHIGELPLEKYLTMAATGDLRNALSRASNIAERERDLVKNLVELGLCVSEQQLSLHDMDRHDLEERVRPFLRDGHDEQVFSLMIDGIRDTEAYANVLGIAGRPIEERQHIVKSHKDRVLKRLQRAVKKGRLRLRKG
jgi:hypothetical protein